MGHLRGELVVHRAAAAAGAAGLAEHLPELGEHLPELAHVELAAGQAAGARPRQARSPSGRPGRHPSRPWFHPEPPDEPPDAPRTRRRGRTGPKPKGRSLMSVDGTRGTGRAGSTSARSRRTLSRRTGPCRATARPPDPHGGTHAPRSLPCARRDPAARDPGARTGPGRRPGAARGHRAGPVRGPRRRADVRRARRAGRPHRRRRHRTRAGLPGGRPAADDHGRGHHPGHAVRRDGDVGLRVTSEVVPRESVYPPGRSSEQVDAGEHPPVRAVRDRRDDGRRAALPRLPDRGVRSGQRPRRLARRRVASQPGDRIVAVERAAR